MIWLIKNIVICFLLLSPSSCKSLDLSILGDSSSKTTWVYLCGLTENFDSTLEKKNREILDEIGNTLNIAFIAVTPPKRCSIYQNMLCWPHNNKQEVLNTYTYIRDKTSKIPISGYIGFSNGGFFLLKLAELKEINVPLIAIGAGGYLGKAEQKNKIFLLIGKQDKSHYALAKQLYQQSRNTQLDITLIEYEGGHVIPEEPLQRIIEGLNSYNSP